MGEGKVRELLKTGAILTVSERLSANKRNIHSSSVLAAKRTIAVEKQERLGCKDTSL